MLASNSIESLLEQQLVSFKQSIMQELEQFERVQMQRIDEKLMHYKGKVESSLRVKWQRESK
jgi:hypothetical protein